MSMVILIAKTASLLAFSIYMTA